MEGLGCGSQDFRILERVSPSVHYMTPAEATPCIWATSGVRPWSLGGVGVEETRRCSPVPSVQLRHTRGYISQPRLRSRLALRPGLGQHSGNRSECASSSPSSPAPCLVLSAFCPCRGGPRSHMFKMTVAQTGEPGPAGGPPGDPLTCIRLWENRKKIILRNRFWGCCSS